MNNAIYTAAIAANEIMNKESILANNLANVSTTGFKSQLRNILKFQFKKNQCLNKRKINFLTQNSNYDFSTGAIKYTKEPLDLAIKDQGWFVVKNKKNKKEFYTRNGHINLNNHGELIIQGLNLIDINGNFIKIPHNYTPIFSEDGTITILKQKDNYDYKVNIGKLKLININNHQLEKNSSGFFQIRNNNVIKNNFLNNKVVKIIQGAIEDSNVNPTENIIEMINNSRQFDMQMKIISLCNENEQKSNSILNINF